jgi:glycosyltransferase involved in cell wall biosynthesis
MGNKNIQKKILFFYGNNPFPAKSGSHQRCLTFLSELRKRGHKIVFLSTKFASDQDWVNCEMKKFKELFANEVCLYNMSFFCRYFTKIISAWYKLILRKNPPLNSIVNTPWEMRKWFRQKYLFYKPDIIIINYAYWNGLVKDSKYQEVVKIIDSHDLVTLNRKLRSVLLNLNESNKNIWSENYWENNNLKPDNEEFKVYENYDYTIAISPEEKKIIDENTYKTKTIYVPITREPGTCNNTYAGNILFVASNNVFNVHGYLFFVKKILPLITNDIQNIKIDIIGNILSSNLSIPKEINNIGVVKYINDYYKNARFFISPVLAGTGQQVKIIEAMANGLPVIIFNSSLRGLPIINGVNGYVVKNSKEFSNRVLELWRNTELCKIFGVKARQIVLENFSQKRFSEEIDKINILKE